MMIGGNATSPERQRERLELRDAGSCQLYQNKSHCIAIPEALSSRLPGQPLHRHTASKPSALTTSNTYKQELDNQTAKHGRVPAAWSAYDGLRGAQGAVERH